MAVSRAVRAKPTDLTGLWRDIYPELGLAHHKRLCCRASLSMHAGLWEQAGVLERTDAAGIKETQRLKPGGGSQIPP